MKIDVNSFEIVSNTAESALIGHSQDYTRAKFKVCKSQESEFALIRYGQ